MVETAYQQGNGRAQAQSTSDFERREAESRRAKVERLDRVADARAELGERHAYYWNELHRLVTSLVEPDSRVLEVGCGLGDLLAVLPGQGNVGIDVSPRMIAHAQKRHPGLDLRVVDVEHDPLPEGPFDVIVLSDAIGLLGDIELAFDR